MCCLSDLLAAAALAIDGANAMDPTVVVVRGQAQPLAMAHGRLAVEWVQRLLESPPDAVLLAARAHHLRRWEVPRSSYPAGRASYLRWRKDQKNRHARDIEAILRGVGYEPDVVEQVQALVRRTQLGSDVHAQVIEDAACLVFIETQLADMAERLDRDRLLEVIRKTASKMSQQGLALIEQLPIGNAERALLAEALAS